MHAVDVCVRVCVCRYGLGSIPEAWLDKYSRSEEVLGYIETLVSL